MTTIAEMNVRIGADTADFRQEAGRVKKELIELESFSRRFADSLSDELEKITFRGQTFAETLGNMGAMFSSSFLNIAMMPLESRIADVIGGFLGVGGLADKRVRAFANGGVLNGPTLFSLNDESLGLAGESGPEAVLPLSRGSDGRLGVAMQGGGATSTHITFNVNTQDADGFRRSQGQIEAMLSRAVMRGQRNL